MFQIFIIDDHALIRSTFKLLINRESDMEVCGLAATATDALAQIMEPLPDVVLIDVSLPDMNGFELMRHLLATFPTLITLMVSGHPSRVYEPLAKREGAQGYVDKMDAPYVLVDKIRATLSSMSQEER